MTQLKPKPKKRRSRKAADRAVKRLLLAVDRLIAAAQSAREARAELAKVAVQEREGDQ